MRRMNEEELDDGLSDLCADENDPHFCQVQKCPDSECRTALKTPFE